VCVCVYVYKTASLRHAQLSSGLFQDVFLSQIHTDPRSIQTFIQLEKTHQCQTFTQRLLLFWAGNTTAEVWKQDIKRKNKTTSYTYLGGRSSQSRSN